MLFRSRSPILRRPRLPRTPDGRSSSGPSAARQRRGLLRAGVLGGAHASTVQCRPAPEVVSVAATRSCLDRTVPTGASRSVVAPPVAACVVGVARSCTLTLSGSGQNPRDSAVFCLDVLGSFSSHVREQGPCTWERLRRFAASGRNPRITNEKSESVESCLSHDRAIPARRPGRVRMAAHHPAELLGLLSKVQLQDRKSVV